MGDGDDIIFDDGDENFDEEEEEEEESVSSNDSDSSSDEESEDVESDVEIEVDYHHPKITKYEVARLISQRAQEIAENGPIFDEKYLNNKDYQNVIQIAIEDYNNGKLPYYLSRKTKKNEKVLIKVNDLIKFPIL